MEVRKIDLINTGGPSTAKRGDPGVHPRVETGPVQFGDDWTGLFIRGDDAFGMASDIRQVKDWYDSLPAEYKNSSVWMAIKGLESYREMINEGVIE